MARITFSITACMHLENGQSRAILSDPGLISQISLTATLVERFSFRYLCPNEHKGKTHYLFSVLSKIDVICFWKGSSDSLELNPQPLWSTEPVHRPIFWVSGNNINIIMRMRALLIEVHCRSRLATRALPGGQIACCHAIFTSVINALPHIISKHPPSLPLLSPPLLLLSLMPNELRDRTPQEIEEK